jgi:hypothetical protein
MRPRSSRRIATTTTARRKRSVIRSSRVRDAGRRRVAAPAQRAQMHAVPCSAGGTRASSAGSKTAAWHQHGSSNRPLCAGRHAFGPPQSGQIGAASGVTPAAEAHGRARPRALRLDLAVARVGGRHQRFDQRAGRRGDFLDRAIERGLVRLRRRM